MTSVPNLRDLAVLDPRSICRRSFLQGLIVMAAEPVLATSSMAEMQSPVLLNRQLIPLDTDHMGLAVPPHTGDRLILRTVAESYWLHSVSVFARSGARHVILVRCRLLPGQGLAINPGSGTDNPVRIDLQHAYLPFSSKPEAIELWTVATGGQGAA